MKPDGPDWRWTDLVLIISGWITALIIVPESWDEVVGAWGGAALSYWYLIGGAPWRKDTWARIPAWRDDERTR